MIRLNTSSVMALLGAALVTVGGAACSQQQQPAAAAAVEEKTFTLTPGTVSLKASFLSGALQDMKITERVAQGTGKVVDPPRLKGTLKLRNISEDQTARLLGGKIEYVDAQGKLIPLADGRQGTNFPFYSYSTDRLDPGMETTQSIEVPFPAAALHGKNLRDIRLELSYIPSPYKEETVNLPVSLGE